MKPDLAARAVRLLEKTEAGSRPVRLLGVSVHNFCGEDDADPDRLPFDTRHESTPGIPRSTRSFNANASSRFSICWRWFGPSRRMRVVDLGCGTGKQTRALHERLQARETMGMDQSPNMLESQANAPLPAGLRFEVGTIEDFPGSYGTFDLVFSNAALHWVDDHDIVAAASGERCRSTRPDGVSGSGDA